MVCHPAAVYQHHVRLSLVVFRWTFSAQVRQGLGRLTRCNVPSGESLLLETKTMQTMDDRRKFSIQWTEPAKVQTTWILSLALGHPEDEQ